ncbi:MAG: glycosyltransferase family 39 protein [Actinobacteria bacterium]|nr:glycosyltransferase family 39 protein [Actinomycetota bacterium]
MPAPKYLAGSEFRNALSYCVRVFLGVRAGLVAVAMLGAVLVPFNQAAGVPGWPAPVSSVGIDRVVTSFERWDALWYLRIASDGYESQDGSAAFFPLYPLVVRALSVALGDSPLGAALIVSHGAFFVAMVLLYLLVKGEADEEIARRAVLYMSLFPSAFFFLAPYSESLFTMLVIACLWSARRSRWLPAGIAGGLAAATRSPGALLVVPLVIEAVMQARRAATGEPGRVRSLAWALACSSLAPVGALIYLGYWRVRSGSLLVPFSEQAHWLREFSWPWVTLYDATRIAWESLAVYPGGFHMLDWMITVPMLCVGLLMLRVVPATYSVYAWTALLLPLFSVFEGRPLMSFPRFILPAFPLFWALAVLGRRPGLDRAYVAISAGGLTLMTVLFVTWYWVF